MHENLKEMALQLVMSITDPKTDKQMQDLLEEARIPMRFQFHALGTASSELLNLCGLGESDRIISAWVLPKKLLPVLFKKMNNNLHFKRRGKGIAFSIPLTGLQLNFARFLDRESLQMCSNEIRQEVHHMAENSQFSMIAIAVSQGYSDEVVDTARKAGAKGGTVIKSRRVGLDQAIHFWGMSFQEEQEIILIIVPKENKKGIMDALCKEHGLNSDAHGLILSLPVSDVMGIEL